MVHLGCQRCGGVYSQHPANRSLSDIAGGVNCEHFNGMRTLGECHLDWQNELAIVACDCLRHFNPVDHKPQQAASLGCA